MQTWTCRNCGLVVYIKKNDPESDQALNSFTQHVMTHHQKFRRKKIEDLITKLRPHYTISYN